MSESSQSQNSQPANKPEEKARTNGLSLNSKIGIGTALVAATAVGVGLYFGFTTPEILIGVGVVAVLGGIVAMVMHKKENKKEEKKDEKKEEVGPQSATAAA